ncbi:MAG TPA: DUF6624 domain-containing protein [Allosphingosinicella sp.]|jgi:hypothetical protein
MSALLALLLAAAPAQPAPARCPTAAEAPAAANAFLKGISTSPLQFEADRSEAITALARREAARRAIFTGTPGNGPFGIVSHYSALARSAPDVRRLELFTRAAEDQFARISQQIIAARTDWAEDLSDGAAAYLGQLIGFEACRADAENTAWLKADIAKNGWYRISAFGPDADNAAWLLVQHSDADPGFQAEMLFVLGKLVAARETAPRNRAYLFDRVAVAEKRLQLYGTQGACTAKGKWEPHRLESPGTVDRLRKEAGLEPLADYKKVMGRACP